MAFGDDDDRDDVPRVTPPPPPTPTPSPGGTWRLSRFTKAIIAFYLVLWILWTVALWFNQQIGVDEARELAERYRVGDEDVYVRTGVVFGADGSVLHNGRSILSIHKISNDNANVTISSRPKTWIW
ncbi:hypothetical protein JCM3774_002806 [Rhodotorula dairenensis]